MMQASHDDCGDFELVHITPHDNIKAVEAGQVREPKEVAVAGSYDFVVAASAAAGGEVETQAEGIRVTTMTRIAVS